MADVIHVCNGGEQAIKDSHTVESLAALDRWKGKEVSAWLVFAHLTWDGQLLSQNYGFDVAQLIRMEFGSAAPIIFYSPFPEEYFHSLPGWKYKLLNGCGSAFLQLGTSNIKGKLDLLLKSTAPLSPTALLDVVTMLCNVRGLVVDRLNHDLKSGNTSTPVFDAVAPLMSDEQKRALDFFAYRDAFSLIDEARNEADFNDLKAKLLHACNRILPSESRRSFPLLDHDNVRHHIILLEDDATYRSFVKQALSKDFTVKDVDTSAEAIDLLKKDKNRGDILAVICDWRLYTNDDARFPRRWQCPQGYSVLEYAAKEGIRALFALTSQDDRIVHAIRNQSDRRYTVFKKEHLKDESQWLLLADVVRLGCMEALRSRANHVVKDLKGWLHRGDHDRSKEETYLEIWNSPNRLQYFSKVDDIADEIWETYLNAPRAYLKAQFPRLEYSGKVNDWDDMETFFLLRRLYFAIWINKGPLDTRDASAMARRRDEVERVIWNIITPSVSRQKRYHLCIDFKDINFKRMFLEEVAWLQRSLPDQGNLA